MGGKQSPDGATIAPKMIQLAVCDLVAIVWCVSAGELGLICGTFFVAAIHAMHLAALLIYGTWSKAPYHLLFHSTMFAVWIGIEVAALHVSKVGPR